MKIEREMCGQVLKKKETRFNYVYHNNNVNRKFIIFGFLKVLFFILVIVFIFDAWILRCFSFKLLKEQNRFNSDNFLFSENNGSINKGEYTYRRTICINRKEPLLRKKICLSNKTFKLRSAKVDAIIESLKNLTLLEASELVKKIEVTFSVDTKQHVEVAKGDEKISESESGSSDEESDDENRVYDLILENIEPNKKIPIIKIVKEIKKDLNLKQAKDLVDNLPQTLFEKINKETADQWKKKLTEAGGIVKLK